MTTKHTPATPLPWDIRFTNTKAQAAADTDYQGHAAVTGDKGDVRYVIHAANAYPRLVEALRRIVDAGGDSLEVSEGAQLLRSLGEE